MARAVLVAINAQWVHTSASVRILRNVAHDAGFTDTVALEFNASDPVWKMAAAISEHAPRVVGLSIYIWNREAALSLARRLRAALPDVVLVGGGPEVSFEPSCPAELDIVVQGEGEEAWKNILRDVLDRGHVPPRHQKVEAPLPHDAVEIYRKEDLATVQGKLVYLETTRGCPFRCAFCLSGRAECRPRPWLAGGLEELESAIHALRGAGVRTMKFLDRTFNAHPAQALENFRRLAAIEGAEFHFEICAELLDEETLSFLENIPEDRFRFEIGVQSLNPEALRLMGRRTDTTLLIERIARLSKSGKVHLHVDLIWGLPGEDFASIRSGFDELFGLVPDEVQLGFLKLLPGAPLQHLVEPHACRFDPEPPYEILSHRDLSGAELLCLKRFEQVFNQLWNTGRFRRTVRHLIAATKMSPFDLFMHLAEAWTRLGLVLPAMGTERICEVLLDLFPHDSILADALRLDYVIGSASPTLPRCLSHGVEIPKHRRDALLKMSKAVMVVQFLHEFDPENERFEARSGLGILWAVHRSTDGHGRVNRLERINSDV